MEKNFLKSTLFISALGLLLQSPDLMAQEAASFIPKSIWQQHAQKQFQGQIFESQSDLGALRYQSQTPQFSIVSIRTKAEAQFQLSQFQNSETGAVKVKIVAQKLLAHAEGFEFAATIQKDLGFGLANLKLNVRCESLTISLDKPVGSDVDVLVSSGALSVQNLNFAVDPQNLKVQLDKCDQVAGFDDLLKNELSQWLKSQVFLQALKDMANQKATKVLTEQLDKYINDTLMSYNISLKATSSLDEDGNIWIFSTAAGDEVLTTEDLVQLKKSPKAISLISKKSFEKNLNQLMNEKLRTVKLSSESHSVLNKLTCSRWYQFFLWPSLKALNKCFTMDFVNRVSEVKLSNVQHLTFDVNIQSWAQNRQGSGPNKDLAFFETKFQSDLKSNKTVLNRFAAQSFPDFVSWAGRSGRISTSFMQSSIEDFLVQTVETLKTDSRLQKFLQATEVKSYKEKYLLIEMK